MKKKTKVDIILEKKAARLEKINNLQPEAPVKVNNFFTCNPVSAKSTNAPPPIPPRDVEEVKIIVNADIAKPKKRAVRLSDESNKFIPTIDISAGKNSKKKK